MAGQGSAPLSEEQLARLSAYLKDVVTLCLENRPQEPIAFIADYFQHIVQGSSPILRAQRFVRLARPDAPSFDDNVLAAYCALDTTRSSPDAPALRLPHVPVAEFAQLVRLLCHDLPIDAATAVLGALEPSVRGQEALTLGQFRAGVKTCLFLEDLCEACELLHADMAHEAARAPVPMRTLALAVLEQLGRQEPSAARGAARGNTTALAALFSPEALMTALQRAASPASLQHDVEGMAAARRVLDRAQRGPVGRARAAAGTNDDITFEELARAVSVVLC